MKKNFFPIVFLLIILCLSGCGNYSPGTVSTDGPGSSIGDVIQKPLQDIKAAQVETLMSWSFQSNAGTNDYSLFFGLKDKNDKDLAVSVDVDIRIVNENNEEVYRATKTITENDFGTYTSQVAGEQFLAEIRIPAKDINEGSSANGTVYFTVHKDDLVRFDEVNCSAFYCLPVAGIELYAEDLPCVVEVKDYSNKVTSKIQINEVQYSFSTGITSSLTVQITGEKIYGTSSAYATYDNFMYKLYDSDGYVIDTGYVYLNSLSEGDKFRDDSIVIYDVVPGEKYEIRFMEFSL